MMSVYMGKTMKATPALLLVVFFTATVTPLTSQAASVALSEAEKKIIQSGVNEKLRDPESSRFKELLASTKDKGDKPLLEVCGLVNSKNGFGGYTGFFPFYGMLASNNKGMQVFILMSSGKDNEATTLHMCQEAGIK